MRARRFPWVIWGISVLLVGLAVYAMVATGGVDPGMEPSTPTQRSGELLMALISATASAIILSRHPSNLIGWVFCAFGLLGPLQQLGISYAATCVDAPGSCYLGIFVVLDALWFVTVALGLGGLFLLFPDGRVPPGRAWLAVLLVSFGVGSLLLAPFSPELYHLDGVANPWALDAPPLAGPLNDALGVLVFLLAVAVIVDFAFRARRATGLARLQNRWLVLAGLLTVLGGVLSVFGQEIGVDLGWAWSLGTATIPIAVTMAITRHRLYEIDRLFSRTVTYAVVVGLLAGAVALVALVAGTLFTEPWVVAATTLGVAALFNPLRRWVQRWVDRRFNRTRYDTEQVMEEFSGSLREEVDTGQVIDGLIGVVEDTMQPAVLAVWVRDG